MARSERGERVEKFVDFVGYFGGYKRDILWWESRDFAWGTVVLSDARNFDWSCGIFCCGDNWQVNEYEFGKSIGFMGLFYMVVE